MIDITYHIDSDFSDFDFEVFSKDQIRDAFVSAIRSIDYDDFGATIIMGASESIDGVTCISATVFSGYCTVELLRTADDRKPVMKKNIRLDDAIRAFVEFYNGTKPALDVVNEQKDCFTIESELLEFPVQVRDRRQIESFVSLLSEIASEECDCCGDDGRFCDEDTCDCQDPGCPMMVLQAPEPVDGLDYVQAMRDSCGWYVEMSFLDGRRRVNFGTDFDDDAEIIRIFNEFMDGNIPDTDGWEKIKF